MNKDNSQQISALIDAELDAAAAADAVDHLLTDPRARETFRRFHTVRDVLQNEYQPALDAGFSARVSAAIAREPLTGGVDAAPAGTASPAAGDSGVVVPMRRRSRAWMPVTGFAVAASLVAVTFFSLQTFDTGVATPPGAQPPQAVQSLAGAPTAVTQTSAASGFAAHGTRWRHAEPDVAGGAVVARLNSLLTDHMEAAGMGKVRGMMVHARVVGYDSDSGSNETF